MSASRTGWASARRARTSSTRRGPSWSGSEVSCGRPYARKQSFERFTSKSDAMSEAAATIPAWKHCSRSARLVVGLLIGACSASLRGRRPPPRTRRSPPAGTRPTCCGPGPRATRSPPTCAPSSPRTRRRSTGCSASSPPPSAGRRRSARRASAEAEERRRREQEESRVLAALAPVQETLRTVQGKVDRARAAAHRAVRALEQQLLATRASSDQVRTTAESLAAALRHNSMRGAWGETQLRRLVESAGPHEPRRLRPAGQHARRRTAPGAPISSCGCPRARASRSTRRCRSPRSSRRTRSRRPPSARRRLGARR